MKHIFIILTFINTTAFAQDDEIAVKQDEIAVKQVVNKLFEGMRKSDTAMIQSTFSSDPVLQTIRKNKDGKAWIEVEPLDSFLVVVSRPHAGIYDERITFDVVKIDGELAMVWAPYKFYVGDKFSHCGVDSFQLIKINGEWKIQYLIDTRHRKDCQ
jgi:hypothetical protein